MTPRIRPLALLVMDAPTFALQFRSDELRRLTQLVHFDGPVCVHELDTPEVRARLRSVEVLLTSWGAPRLTEDRLAAAPRLQAVLHCAGSVRGLIDDSIWRHGVILSSAADQNAVPVAEFTLAAIIMAGKKAPFLAAKARRDPKGWATALGREDLSNCGRTIGLVGFSRVGRRVVRLLGMLDTAEVLVSDPFADAESVAEAGGRLVDLDDLLRRSEILSLHAPSLPETRHLIGARELAMLPDGATLINTARGALVDQDALFLECSSGRIDAILDVTDPEPMPPDSPFHELLNVVITPHVAGSLGAEARRMSNHALEELGRWLDGDSLSSPVTSGQMMTRA